MSISVLARQVSCSLRELRNLTYNSVITILLCSILIVGCGDDGVRPPDDCPTGACWKLRDSGTDYFLWGVDRSDNLFVAVGFDGAMVSSTDGIDWAPLSSGIKTTLFDILWSGDQFVAVGDHAILRSPDGLSWTIVTEIDAPGPFLLEGVASSGSTYVAVDSPSGQIFTSYDYGVSWEQSVDGDNNRALWEITCSGSVFVAVGAVSYLDPPRDVCLVAVSVDGSEWSFDTLDVTGELFDVTWTGSQLVAVGGLTLPVAGTAIVTSPDGLTWTQRPVGTIDPLFAVWSVDGTIIAVGFDGTILTSEDGIEWIERNSGVSNALYGITSSDERIVVVGTNGTILSSP